MRHAIAAVVTLGLLATATTAVADVTDRWVAIDKVAVSLSSTSFGGQRELVLTGVRDGAAAVQTSAYVSDGSTEDREIVTRCERLVLLALTRPGRYVVEITRENGTLPRYHMSSCRLARVD